MCCSYIPVWNLKIKFIIMQDIYENSENLYKVSQVYGNIMPAYFCDQCAVRESDVSRCDHVSVVMDAGSYIVNFIINFIMWWHSLHITLK